MLQNISIIVMHAACFSVAHNWQHYNYFHKSKNSSLVMSQPVTCTYMNMIIHNILDHVLHFLRIDMFILADFLSHMGLSFLFFII